MNAHRLLQDLFLSPYSILDPRSTGAIQVDRSLGQCKLRIDVASETRYLPVPLKDGLRITISVGYVGAGATAKVAIGALSSSSTITTTIDGTNKYATLNGYGQFLELISIPSSATAYQWSLVANQGTTLSAT